MRVSRVSLIPADQGTSVARAIGAGFCPSQRSAGGWRAREPEVGTIGQNHEDRPHRKHPKGKIMQIRTLLLAASSLAVAASADANFWRYSYTNANRWNLRLVNRRYNSIHYY
jgi:hypothetical protein